MWNSLSRLSFDFLQSFRLCFEFRRTTFILRRIRPVKLNKLGTTFPKKLKRSSYYYELVENSDTKKKPLLELVLLKDVPGVGMLGEKIKANYYTGYSELLLPKLAVYADSPEALSIARSEDNKHYSSMYSKIIENYLAGQALAIFMNAEMEWILQPWHVKYFLRKKGLLVNEECIILPEKKITGPNINIENKDFIVTLIMNKSDKFLLRCRIYNSSTTESTLKDSDILYVKSESLFPEDQETVENLRKTAAEIRKNQMLTGKNTQLKKKKKTLS